MRKGHTFASDRSNCLRRIMGRGERKKWIGSATREPLFVDEIQEGDDESGFEGSAEERGRGSKGLIGGDDEGDGGRGGGLGAEFGDEEEEEADDAHAREDGGLRG